MKHAGTESDLLVALAKRRREIAANSGRWRFFGLFTKDGRRVKAKLVAARRRYGNRRYVWLVLDEDDRATEWVPARATAALRRKGYREDVEEAPAAARIRRVPDDEPRVEVYRIDAGYPDGALVKRKNGGSK